MPRLTHEHGSTWISVAELEQDLADGTLPDTVEIHHPPWTGQEARQAREIAALSAVLSTPAARRARRLAQRSLPWRTGLLGMALLLALWLPAPPVDAFVARPVVALLTAGGALDPVLLLSGIALLLPVAMAERVASLGPIVAAAAACGIGLATWGVLCGMSGPLLALGGLCGAAAAGLGTLARVRPSLPPLRRELGRWTAWVLLGGLLVSAATLGPEPGVLLVGTTAAGGLLGWRLPDRWWSGLLGLNMLLLAVAVAGATRADPARWLRGWREESSMIAGFHARLPGILPPLEEVWGMRGDTLTTWRSTHRAGGDTLRLTLVVAHADDVTEDATGHRRAHHGQGGLLTRVTCQGGAGWQDALCADLIAGVTLTDPFPLEATRLALHSGARHAAEGHLVALLAADQRAEAWRHLLAIYPVTGDIFTAQDRNNALLRYAMRHGGCAAAEQREPLQTTAERREMFETCLSEAAGESAGKTGATISGSPP